MRYFLVVSFVALLLAFSSCESPNDPIVVKLRPQPPLKVDFEQTEAFLTESDAQFSVNIEFSRASITAGTITLQINEISGFYDSDYSTVPEKSGNTIHLDFPSGSTLVSFNFSALIDDDDHIEKVEFEISEVMGENMELGSSLLYLVSIEDEVVVNPKYAACLAPLSTQTLDIVTWNLKFFPTNNLTIGLTMEIIENMDADVIALQELTNSSDFNELVGQLDGWQGTYFNVASLDLGFIYKTSEITDVRSETIIFENESSPFPREPVLTTITHSSGMEITLINLHLKCCDDGEARRGDASVLLKEYIDTNLPNDNVIVLGDLNDDILSGSPFTNFIEDTDNYLFTDMAIAEGSSSNWSYPSWPSHLDHILISNELFDEFESVKTIKLQSCVSNYNSSVSDHRPVMASFRP